MKRSCFLTAAILGFVISSCSSSFTGQPQPSGQKKSASDTTGAQTSNSGMSDAGTTTNGTQSTRTVGATSSAPSAGQSIDPALTDMKVAQAPSFDVFMGTFCALSEETIYLTSSPDFIFRGDDPAALNTAKQTGTAADRSAFCSLSAVDQDNAPVLQSPSMNVSFHCQVRFDQSAGLWKMSAPSSCSQVSCRFHCMKFK